MSGDTTREIRFREATTGEFRLDKLKFLSAQPISLGEATRTSKMITAIPGANLSHAITATSSHHAAPSSTATAKPAQSEPRSTSSSAAYTVELSSAARAAQQEARETPAQTAKEASVGDRQAQRLLAKEAAARQTGR